MQTPWGEIKRKYEVGAAIPYLAQRYLVSEREIKARKREYEWKRKRVKLDYGEWSEERL